LNIYQLLTTYQGAASIYEMPIRVAYYARVSSEKDQQLHSLDNQIDYYEGLIRNTPSWTFAGGYVDQGITGTCAQRREQFLQMIQDGQAGAFDLVITKEISRFARNTLDSIQYTRTLFAAGVGVFFENDNINTLSSDGELRLTILSSIAQDEVRKLSQRVRYGFRCAQNKGVVLGNNAIWGYTKEAGKLRICPEEAAVVRRIFERYATSTIGLRRLSEELAEEGMCNRNGKPFSYSTLRSILSNPKYKGFYCGRKSSAPPLFLPQGGGGQKLPEEEWLLYPAEDRVPPIVSPEIWQRANDKLARRGGKQGKETGETPPAIQRRSPSGKLLCARHGVAYYRGSYRTGSSPRPLWMCPCYQRHGRDRQQGCDKPVVYEPELFQAVALALEEAAVEPDSVARTLAEVYEALSQKTGTGGKRESLTRTLHRQQERLSRLLELRLDGELSAQEYASRKEQLELQLAQTQRELSGLGEETALLPTWEEIAALLEPTPHLGEALMERGVEGILVDGEGEPHLTVTLSGQAPVEVQVARRRGKPALVTRLSSEGSGSGT
jgi:DNA invertase Pin-like site-specific DNA recombinase